MDTANLQGETNQSKDVKSYRSSGKVPTPKAAKAKVI